jgi:hypothetical protein
MIESGLIPIKKPRLAGAFLLDRLGDQMGKLQTSRKSNTIKILRL